MKKEFLLFISLLMGLSACSSSDSLKSKSLDEKNGELYYSHGTASLVDKDYTKALDQLLKALKHLPDDARIHNNLGMAYLFKDRPGLALKHLQRSIELNPDDSSARNNIASLYLQQRRYDEAKREYQKVLEDLLYQYQFRTYYNLGLIEERLQNPLAAKKYYNLSLENKPDYCPAHFRLGAIAKEQGDYEAARSSFRQSTMGTCHKEPAGHFEEALMLVKLKQYRDAEIKIENFLKKFSRSSMVPRMRRHLSYVRKKISSRHEEIEDLSLNDNSDLLFDNADKMFDNRADLREQRRQMERTKTPEF